VDSSHQQALLAISDVRPRMHPLVARAAKNLLSACDAIKAHLIHVHRETTPEAFARYCSDMSTVMLRLSEAGVLDEQRGVAIALDTLVSYILPRIVDDSAGIKFASCLRIVITAQASCANQGELLCLTVAARALGRLVRASDMASRADFTKFEAERALEWLELPVHVSKRLAACLILRHLCDTEAILVISKVASSFLPQGIIAMERRKKRLTYACLLLAKNNNQGRYSLIF